MYHWLCLAVSFVSFCASAQNLRLVTARDQSIEISSANQPSCAPFISRDGSAVVFSSLASDLLTNGSPSRFSQLYLQGSTGGNILISKNTNGLPAAGDSRFCAMSPNGSRIIFESDAPDLVPMDFNGMTDTFVYDRATQSISLLTPMLDRLGTPDRGATSATMSGNGAMVAFESESTNLVADAPPRGANVYIRNLTNNETRCVTTNGVIPGFQLGSGQNSLLSSDGSHIVFAASVRTNNARFSTNFVELVWRDLGSGETRVLSTNLPAALGGSNLFHVEVRAMSDDGQKLTFLAKTEYARRLFYSDLTNSRPLDATTDDPAILSRDGRFLSYSDGTNQWLVDVVLWTAQLLPFTGWSHRFTDDATSIAFLRPSSTASNFESDLCLYDLGTGQTRVLNLTSTSNLPAGDVSAFDLSGDGKNAVFQSYDSDLVPNDRNRALDVFLLAENRPVRLLSSSARSGSVANGFSFLGSRSSTATGAVVFASYANNLVTNDSNNACDIFVRDTISGALQLVSVNTNGTPGNGQSISPVISRDGRFVAFCSSATDLASGLTGSFTRVFLRDRTLGTTRLIGGDPNLSSPFGLAINADGRAAAYVAGKTLFYWRADLGLVAVTNEVVESKLILSRDGENLVYANTNHIKIWNASSGFTTNLSAARYGATPGDFTDDGEIFYTRGSAPGYMYVYFLGTRRTQYEGTRYFDVAPTRPSMSGDKRYMTYTYRASSFPVGSEIYLWDRARLVNVPVLPTNVTWSGFSDNAFISPNGRFVVFQSTIAGIPNAPSNTINNIFLRDLQLNTLSILSSPLAPADGHSLNPVFTEDESAIIFSSQSSNLLPGDGNSTGDIFYFPLPGAIAVDSDHDGLDDGWEREHFGNLLSTGADDNDRDGKTNLQEFLAGSDPTVAEVRSYSMKILPDYSVLLGWPASPGGSYRVERSSSLVNPNWLPLQEIITIEAGQASLQDRSSATDAQRFYRILQVP